MSKRKEHQIDITASSDLIEAHTSALFACGCGCNALKLLALDDNDVAFASISYTPEQWLNSLIPQIEAECRRLMGMASQ